MKNAKEYARVINLMDALEKEGAKVKFVPRGFSKGNDIHELEIVKQPKGLGRFVHVWLQYDWHNTFNSKFWATPLRNKNHKVRVDTPKLSLQSSGFVNLSDPYNMLLYAQELQRASQVAMNLLVVNLVSHDFQKDRDMMPDVRP